MTRREAARYPGPHPRFHELWQSLTATWDVWSSMHAGREHIQRLMEQRLRESIAWARGHSSFYRQLYRGLPPGECRIDDLPVVTKHDLMAHFDTVVVDPDVTDQCVREFLAQEDCVGRPLLDRYAVWTSSGTTGEPGVFVHDGRALAIYEALEVLRFRRLTSPAMLAAASIADDRYAFVGATGGHFAGNASVERLRSLYPWLADRMRVFSILESARVLSRRLNEYQPTLLATYPTAASLLAEEQQLGRLTIQPREIWTGGERLSSAQHARIADAFGCKVRNDYGASEFRAIACDCSCGTLHVNADWIVLEPVDERRRPVPAGRASHTVLLTNLANRVQPLIRYDLGDSVTWLEQPCECGSVLPAIRIEGRCDDTLAVSDATGATVKLLPLALTTVLEDQAGVSRFQLLQVGASALLLRLDSQSSTADLVSRCRQTLGRFLEVQGTANVRLDIEQCTLQPHPVSGKLRRIVGRHATHRWRQQAERQARAHPGLRPTRK